MFFKLLLSIAEMGWTFLWVFLKKLQVRCWCVGRVHLVVQGLSSAWAPEQSWDLVRESPDMQLSKLLVPCLQSQDDTCPALRIMHIFSLYGPQNYVAGPVRWIWDLQIHFSVRSLSFHLLPVQKFYILIKSNSSTSPLLGCPELLDREDFLFCYLLNVWSFCFM